MIYFASSLDDSAWVIDSFAPPLRHTQDSSRPNAYGRALVELCKGTGVFIANGRSCGDEAGAITYDRGRSIIDYCVVDQRMFSQLQVLRVLPNVPLSDHHPLEGQFIFPIHQPYNNGLHEAPSRPAREVPIPKYVPEKREEYGATLDHLLRGFTRQVTDGEVTRAEAAERLRTVIYGTACSVFGTVKSSPGASARDVNPWFKHCKTEHKALRRAIELGDTHAAREYRKAFNHVKRRWKRYYSNKLLSRMRDDIRHNPRRFWLYFKGAKRREFVQDLVSWSQYWESLFGGGEQTWLQQGAADVAALVSELGLDTTLGAKHKASKLNEPIELDEMAVVFNKLKRGKAAGPDGIRAEFLKDAVVREFEEEDGSHPVFRNVLLELVT